MDDQERQMRLEIAERIVKDSRFTIRLLEFLSVPLVMCMCFTSYLSATETIMYSALTIALAFLFGIAMHIRDLSIYVHDYYLKEIDKCWLDITLK